MDKPNPSNEAEAGDEAADIDWLTNYFANDSPKLNSSNSPKLDSSIHSSLASQQPQGNEQGNLEEINPNIFDSNVEASNNGPPIVDASIADTNVNEPVVEAPVVEAPVVEAPVVEAPIVEAPVVEENPLTVMPLINDANFNVKIASRPEFARDKYDGTLRNVESYAMEVASREFYLQPHQQFVRKFMSPATPYKSLLLYHGLGSGKTLTAIGVCEEMRRYNQQMGFTDSYGVAGIVKKIIIVASPNVLANFRMQLFDKRNLEGSKEKGWQIKPTASVPSSIDFIAGLNTVGMSKEKVEEMAMSQIYKSYAFVGYKQFMTQIERAIARQDGSDYVGTTIVIDEFHNIRSEESEVQDKKMAKMLMDFVGLVNGTTDLVYGNNEVDVVYPPSHMKLLLLSATPMFNSFKEIIWVMNLLNMNDNRGTVQAEQIFDEKGNWLNEDARELFLLMATGHVSYVRGENPYTFPFRVFPRHYNGANTNQMVESYPQFSITGLEIPDEMKMRFLDLYPLAVESYQLLAYNYVMGSIRQRMGSSNSKGKGKRKRINGFSFTIISLPLQILNIAYPCSTLTNQELESRVEKLNPALAFPKHLGEMEREQPKNRPKRKPRPTQTQGQTQGQTTTVQGQEEGQEEDQEGEPDDTIANLERYARNQQGDNDDLFVEGEGEEEAEGEEGQQNDMEQGQQNNEYNGDNYLFQNDNGLFDGNDGTLEGGAKKKKQVAFSQGPTTQGPTTQNTTKRFKLNSMTKTSAFTANLAPLESANASGMGEVAKSELTCFIGKEGLLNVMERQSRGSGYKYRDGAERIFEPENIGKYSAKIGDVCNNQLECEGIVLIYSQWLESGILPMALALESMGYERSVGKGQVRNLFHSKPNARGQGQGTGQARATGQGQGQGQQRYVIICGDKDVSPNNEAVIKELRSDENAQGELIKVVLITKAGSEGLDLSGIRKLVVMDPWFNLNRLEQIIGRAARNLSHRALPYLKWNVQIILYCSLVVVPGQNANNNNNNGQKDSEESADMYVYRMAELNALVMSKINRYLKRISVDCLLNYGQTNFAHENFVASGLQSVVMQQLSSGAMIEMPVGDMDGSSQCDYMECQYDCLQLHNRHQSHVETQTDIPMNPYLMTMNQEAIQQKVRVLFLQQHYYTKRMMLSILNCSPLELDIALSEILLDEAFVLIDKYGNPGKMVNYGDYYIYQPLRRPGPQQIPPNVENKPTEIEIPVPTQLQRNREHIPIFDDQEEELEEARIGEKRGPSAENVTFNAERDIIANTRSSEKLIRAVYNKMMQYRDGMNENGLVGEELSAFLEATMQQGQQGNAGFKDVTFLLLAGVILDRIVAKDKLKILNALLELGDVHGQGNDDDYRSSVHAMNQYFARKVFNSHGENTIMFLLGPLRKESKTKQERKNKKDKKDKAKQGENVYDDVIHFLICQRRGGANGNEDGNGNKWVNINKEDARDEMVEIVREYYANHGGVVGGDMNEYIGFVGFTKNKLQLIFKIAKSKLRYGGRACGTDKAQAIHILQQLVSKFPNTPDEKADLLDIWKTKNAKECCKIQEYILRFAELAQINNLVFFFNTETAAINQFQ